MRVLNLYAGLGGNRKLWENVQVTAVEQDEKIASVYKNLHPLDEIIIGDAHEYLRSNFIDFDFIWSSIPCQTHSKMAKGTRHKNKKFPDMKLYEEILFLDNFFAGAWVVENVKPYYEPLIQPTVQIGRHLFWSSFKIDDFDSPTTHSFIDGTNNTAGAERLKKWLGIQYEGNIYYKDNHCPGQVLRNCVHPDLGFHILSCFKKDLEHKPEQLGLFA